MDEGFGRLIRQHQDEIGLDDWDYRKAIADEGRKYDLQISPIHRNTLGRWRKGLSPSALHAVLISDLTGIPAQQLGDSVGRSLTEDRIRRVIAQAGGNPGARARSSVRLATAPPMTAVVEASVGAFTELDWSRLARTARSVRWVDTRVVQDQWTITRHYIDSLPEISPRSLLDLIGDHITRLRQLQTTTSDDRLRRELTVMLCQMAICAGIAYTGMTDYGLALESYRYCVRLAEEAHEDWLRATGLVLEAQLYGGALQRRLALSPSKIRGLIEAAEAGARLGLRPESRAFVHSTRSMLLALLNDGTAAARALDQAHRAEAQVQPARAFYFTMPVREYRVGHEAGVAMVLRRPFEAVQLYSEALARTDEIAVAQQTWFRWGRAEAYLRAEAVELAAVETREALRLARVHRVPFLLYGVEKVAETLVSRFGRMPMVQELEEHLLADV
jgi:hypothetical protein